MPETQTAIFAGGCFWCMTPPFEHQPGVIQVLAGYTGGQGAEPSYQDYAEKGHVEAVKVTFNPAQVRYSELLEIFWRNIDPTDAGGQFADRGSGYQSAIFTLDGHQKALAEASKLALQASGRFKEPLATRILPAGAFTPAEGYHQDYYLKNPSHYERYAKGSGRKGFLHKVWSLDHAADSGVPVAEHLAAAKALSPLQVEVTQRCGTEPPFANAYWDEHREGIYVDLISGKPLFSSKDKFDSRTGWPSFTQPLDPGEVEERADTSAGMQRVEVRSRAGNAHLGHVFNDGPMPTGQRYCINSASLRFIPLADLEKEGYGKYLGLFQAR